MVRLITHNMLSCHVRNCTKDNFPLAFADVELVVRPTDENLEFLRRFLPKLDWAALVDTARALGDTTLPDAMPADDAWTEDMLKALHHVLLEIHVEEGKMVCRGCGHIYPIQNGIPNMRPVSPDGEKQTRPQVCEAVHGPDTLLLAEHEISR